MKLNFFVLFSAALLGTAGYSQTGGGAGGGATGGAGTAGAGASGSVGVNGAGGQGVGAAGGVSTSTSSSSGQASSTTSSSTGGGVRVNQQPLLPGGGASSQQNPNPSQQNPNPYLPPRGPFPPTEKGTGIQTFATNGVATPQAPDTNQFALNTNQPAPNQVGLANSNQFSVTTNMTPTSQPGFTNRVMATNTPGLLTNNSQLMRDQALSEGDRRLLGQIRTAVFGPSGAPAPLGGTAVHFILRDGVVRLVGFVPNAEEQKRIESIVQGIPGVVRVYDALQIGVSAVPGQSQ